MWKAGFAAAVMMMVGHSADGCYDDDGVGVHMDTCNVSYLQFGCCGSSQQSGEVMSWDMPRRPCLMSLYMAGPHTILLLHLLH